ncbi:MAG: hypothetical protein MI861_22520, partial [Pirellulales bacterium]|nr:hypothetical protein [Pirellulales bacterium]
MSKLESVNRDEGAKPRCPDCKCRRGGSVASRVNSGKTSFAIGVSLAAFGAVLLSGISFAGPPVQDPAAQDAPNQDFPNQTAP